MNAANIRKKMHIWRLRHISERYFVLILSVLVGAGAGLAAVILKTLVRKTYVLLMHIRVDVFGGANILLLIFPAIGITLYDTLKTAQWDVNATPFTVSPNTRIAYCFPLENRVSVSAADSAGTLEALKRPGAAEPAQAGDAVVAPKQEGAQGFYKVWVSDAPMEAE